jgi:RimJ/RimL family protein N-acetyltransferase
LRLIDVYLSPGAIDVLWQLLLERDPRENISHKAMPTWERHSSFVAGRPYDAWYLIDDGGISVGACYVTKQREIGIGILKAHRRKGYAEAAIKTLLQGPGRFLANINPRNEASIALFRKLGFSGPIQVTYERA